MSGVSDYSTTAASNTTVGGIGITGSGNVSQADDAMRAIMADVAAYTRIGANLASAGTLNLDSVDTLFLAITGTTTVTAVTLTADHVRWARATGAFQMTASATLIVNGSTSKNYTTVAGDLLFFEGFSASTVRVWVVGRTPTSGIPGSTTNDSAAAGYIGEVISSTVLIGSAVSLTTNTTANVTSISLTAGDWDVTGNVAFNPGATTTISAIGGGISTTSATFPTSPNAGGTASFNATFTTGTAQILPIGKRRISLSGTTTVYLVAQAGFGVSTMGAYGHIEARRAR